ncbi:MAG: VanW family protein [Clostridiales bacterium]|jgi:vancomycin resistance protein YoaR|nr:VanW family protein [Eubacteriales bacterium]MDH7566913.1 VanW family protein [Clostridiales bacterium]
MKRKSLYLIFAFICLPLLAASCGQKAQNSPRQESVPQPQNIVMEGTPVERTSKSNVYLEGMNVGGLSESQLKEKILSYVSAMGTGGKNVRINGTTAEVVEQGKVVKKIDIAQTLENLLNSPEGAKVKLVAQEIKPDTTAQKSNTKVTNTKVIELGKCTTTILDKDPSRVNNIKLAANKINNKKLQPGEEFSFNRTVGRRTEAKGYEEAPIIIKTEDGPKKGYATGGGVCQLATTLYNAVNRSGLEITERHIHSKDVGYVPKGKDATVSYGSVDFKFRNNRSYPIVINAYVGKGAITVKILENRS